MDVRVEHLEHAVVLKWEGPRQHLVGHGRERIAIGRRADLAAGDLLRRHVGGGAGGGAGHGVEGGRLQELDQAEVGDDRRPVARHQHVGRLHVPVDDTQRMRIVEAGRDALQVLERRGGVELSLLHLGGQAAPRHVLDDHVRRPLVLAVIEYVEDVRVAHLGDGLSLPAEAGDGVGIRRDPVHHLDRAGSCKWHVVGAIDDAHGALAYEVLDLILTQPRSRFDRHAG